MTTETDCYNIILKCPKCKGTMTFEYESGDDSVGLQSCAGWGCEECGAYIDLYDILRKCSVCGKNASEGNWECVCKNSEDCLINQTEQPLGKIGENNDI
jgi:hypothetical protein